VADIDAVVRHIEICSAGVVNILDKFSWIAVLFLKLCVREAASHVKEETMQLSSQTFALP
jgi:hypothetical protein